MAIRFRSRLEDPMVGWALLVALSVALFFFVFMAVAANPFQVLDTSPVDGRGPNPLLQNHPLMAFHPPMLYLGYVGFTVPFAFAMAALITGRFGEGWLEDTRRTTLVAWGFLSVGILLGAWWSYEVLGWGGYWGWDPVENASLLPWLTGTAFIHSVIVQERRGMLRVWNLSLVLATFCLTILGTFLTRSGVVNSVHAFTQSSIGPWLLGFLAVTVATCLGLIAWRADKLHAPGRIDSPVSREAAFLANNLLFTGLAFVVLLGTVFPLVAEALRGNQLAVGEPYFARMTTPIGLGLLFLMAVAPALPWRAVSGDVLRRRLLVPAYAGVIAMLLTVVFLTRSLSTVLAFGLATFAIVAIIRETGYAVRARRNADRLGWVRSFTGTVRSNPRRYGGFVVHIGVICIAVALAASGSFGTEREVRLRRGDSVVVGGYTVTFQDTRTSRTAQKTSISALLALGEERAQPRHLRARGLHLPEQQPGDRHALGPHRHPRGRLPDDRVVTERAGPRHRQHRGELDDALALDRRRAHGARDDRRDRTECAPPDRSPAPGRRRGRACSHRSGAHARAVGGRRGGRVSHPWRWVVLAVGAGISVLAVVLALTVSTDPQEEWNTSRLVGQAAPAFSVEGLDGRPITSESLAGKTVLVNFWNSWCIPCLQEHDALVTWFERNRSDSGVVLLGIVRDDSRNAVRDYVQDENVEWPVAFDPGAKAALDFGTRGQPETYAIGPDGVVVASIFGPVTPPVLDQMVARAQGTG